MSKSKESYEKTIRKKAKTNKKRHLNEFLGYS